MTRDLAPLARRTREIYERNAARFDAERLRTGIESAWLSEFTEGLPAGAPVLDLGCGAGEPVAAWLIGAGFAVTGLDIAPAMLALARRRWPACRWIEGDMRGLDLGETFDGILGWHSFFHLTAKEQREALPAIAAHLRPGGALMLTVGPEAGEVAGRVGDDPVYHASLSEAEYGEILAGQGIRIARFVRADPGCDGATVLLGRKAAIPSS
ncbi:methyltransferase [Pseudooceanicola batsensis HTCC2597]|uniref:Methyltransferase n=1 Tax=Pseudooceanicola batsensis (strain ATCC BAA-863 / DSM 15984 / KCTC 12145 / HTCC2597) TaxID=252305 RepID=A3TTN9_PSEBH|nr:class I SAM-dependent methyltransferase [Pseudooceanicola batsensis]EAQ05016.1 methyltransferase [Pseudooceanicola batsensis HTCC2597]